MHPSLMQSSSSIPIIVSNASPSIASTWTNALTTSKKRKGIDDDAAGAMLYRKTDDGSVKIAITHNGKMKVKIDSNSLNSIGGVASSIATTGSLLAHSVGVNGAGSLAASNAVQASSPGMPPIAPIFSKSHSKNVNSLAATSNTFSASPVPFPRNQKSVP
ncbi:hypothetical protein BJ741DRAFT_389739 [Chytriomyces cf. hyalinus JEL632]|nr:hypothetical protein BJ741DRAFT_389739 [Chytriomyces cf. hyalinus JEL632]